MNCRMEVYRWGLHVTENELSLRGRDIWSAGIYLFLFVCFNVLNFCKGKYPHPSNMLQSNFNNSNFCKSNFRYLDVMLNFRRNSISFIYIFPIDRSSVTLIFLFHSDNKISPPTLSIFLVLLCFTNWIVPIFKCKAYIYYIFFAHLVAKLRLQKRY